MGTNRFEGVGHAFAMQAALKAAGDTKRPNYVLHRTDAACLLNKKRCWKSTYPNKALSGQD